MITENPQHFLPFQADLAAKHPHQTTCPNNPTGTARPWRAWVRTDYYSGTNEFSTCEEAVKYLAYQVKRSPGTDLNSDHKRTEDRVHYVPTFLQHTDTGRVWSLADLGLVPVYEVALPPPNAQRALVELHPTYHASLEALVRKHTFTDIKKSFYLLDRTITRKNDGEYRVAPIAGTPAEREARAYYTTDLADAVGTAIIEFARENEGRRA